MINIDDKEWFMRTISQQLLIKHQLDLTLSDRPEDWYILQAEKKYTVEKLPRYTVRTTARDPEGRDVPIYARFITDEKTDTLQTMYELDVDYKPIELAYDPNPQDKPMSEFRRKWAPIIINIVMICMAVSGVSGLVYWWLHH